MSIIVNGKLRIKGVTTAGPGGGGGGASYLLDTYGGAAVAYSLRKLSSTYSGNAIRVRRSSDNTEQNIGFDGSGNLDTTALTTFVGGGNGFVTTWYDQSGNGKDAIQSTAYYQPRIVNNGVLYTFLGKPSMEWLSLNLPMGFVLNLSSGSYTSASAFTVVKPAVGNGIIYTSPSSNNFHHPYIDGVTYDGFFMSSRLTLGGNISNGNCILQQINNGTSLTDYYNNTSTNTVNGTFTKPSSYRIGNNLNYYNFIGPISEHILWLSDKTSDRTGINSNINTYYSIY